MIDFRYHVVSIVAIFLALTVGLVIGASILSGSLANSLRNDLSKANNQITGQQTEIKSLNTQIDQQNRYIDETASQLVAGRLAGQCAALVQIDGADSGAYSAMRTMVQKQTGASLCSDTSINAALTDASSQNELTGLLKEHTPAGQILNGTVAQQAAELIAEALTTYQTSQQTGTSAPNTASTPTAPATPNLSSTALAGGSAVGAVHAGATTAATSPGTPGTMTGSAALATLEDFQSAGMITMASAPAAGQQATLAYVQAPSAPDANPDADNGVWLAFVEALRKGGAGTVVGGSGTSADKGGLVYTIINDSTATREISTVDDSDTTMGQVASVFCLFDQSQGSTATVAGHYGTGTDNDGPIPSIAADLG